MRKYFFDMRTAFLLAALVSAALAGCYSKPVADSETVPVPGERVLIPQLLIQEPGTALVVVKRDVGMVHSLCPAMLFVDSHQAADLMPGERVNLFLTPGTHVLGAKLGGLCTIPFLSEVQADAAMDRKLTFRIYIKNEQTFGIMPTAY